MLMGLLEKIYKKTPKRNKESGNFLIRYFKSLFHAIEGLVYALRYEHNMIIITLAIAITTCFGFFFNISSAEWLFVIAMFGSVTATEMINTSIEATIDLVTTEMKPLAKIAKDTASTATLILSITALIGAIIIFMPKILIFIGG